MNYNYDFDIAALILYAVIVVTYLSNKHVKNATSSIFSWLLFCCVMTPMLDIVGGEAISRQAHPVFVHVANNLYYLSEQASNFLFLVYVLSILEMSSRMALWKKIAVVLPFAYSAVVIITNPIHGYLYTWIDNTWTSGPFRFFIVFAPVAYFGGALIYSFVIRKNFSRRYSAVIISIAIINSAARAIQFFIPSFLVYSFSVAVGMLLVLVGIQMAQKKVDSETGLANKIYLAESTRKFMYNCVPFTTIMVRIADYDTLTTSYGIRLTEQFVQNIAFDLQSVCSKFQVYQVSNSCFAIALVDGEQENSVDVIGEVSRILEKPWKVNGAEITCSYYMTSVKYPDQCPDRETFLTYLAYFQEIKDVQYGVVPPEELNIYDRKREAEVEAAIERAIKDSSFEVFYQPICKTDTKEFVLAEALARLKDPILGNISPGEFIPIAEKNGTIIDVGNIILEKACRFMKQHDLQELGLQSIEVNLSTTQCLQRDFIDVVRKITGRYNVEPGMLNFEITETASNCSPAIFTENLEMLKNDGYHLILDDYGSGYSNLQRLVSTKFDLIKFDKDMIQKTIDDAKFHELLEKTQTIFKSMGAKIVAEGVETEEQYEFLKSISCDYIQGYYFSQALPEEQFVEFLRKQKKS